MTKSAIPLAVFLVVASSAAGQIDAFSLQSKYGAPLDRETFTVRPGVEMVVDYGPGKQACRIQLPSGERTVGTVALALPVTRKRSGKFFPAENAVCTADTTETRT